MVSPCSYVLLPGTVISGGLFGGAVVAGSVTVIVKDPVTGGVHAVIGRKP